MKIWKWYKNLTKEEFEAAHHLKTEEKYPLYAFTNNKKFRDLFRKMRRDDMFIEMKSDVEEHEYVEFANSHRGNMLEMHPFEKIIRRDGTTAETEQVKLLTTWYEKEYVQSSIEAFGDQCSGFMGQDFPFSPIAFLDKYFYALYRIQYVDFWKLYAQDNITKREEEIITDLGIDIDYSYPEITFDEFAVFVFLFGGYMKI